MYTVTSGGYNSRHSSDFFMFRPNGLAHHVLLIVKCPSLFQIGGTEITASQNCAILIRPHIPYQYHSIKGKYSDDWLHFDCDDPLFSENAEFLFHQPIPIGSAAQFTLYIQQIMWEHSYAAPDFRSLNVDMLMKVLFNNLIQARQKQSSPVPHSPYISRLQNLRLSLQSQPGKNITLQQAAQELDISSSYFQYLYKQFFGISFKADLINIRIDYAKDLILNSGLKLTHIAQLCGYQSEIHFYRQFKAKTGMTPGEYQEKTQGIVFSLNFYDVILALFLKKSPINPLIS